MDGWVLVSIVTKWIKQRMTEETEMVVQIILENNWQKVQKETSKKTNK